MNWQLLKKPLLEALNFSREKGKLFDSALKGLISLIPKKNKDSRIIANMRPITLLNTDYKLLEKVLALRLRPTLETLINQDQKGFMQNRNISCNIRRILDIIDYAEEENLPGIIVSLDFEKCFDRIDTEALIEALKYFGYGENFCAWTGLLYKQAKACVINNGHMSEYFSVERGTKQGGPTSAYYFLILAEVLAIELRKNSAIIGVNIEELNKIFGQFADDMDCYIFGGEESLRAVFQTISEFESNSGFKINYNKTTIYRVGSIKRSNAKMYCAHNAMWTKEPINILGVNISVNPTENFDLNYNSVINKSESVITCWKNRGLSLIGKIMIINSLIVSLFVYKMSVLTLMPKNIVTKINDMIRRFIWNDKKQKIPLNQLQKNKDDGGLGLVNIELKDLALKAVWAIRMDQDELIQKFAKRKLNLGIDLQDLWKCNINFKDINKEAIWLYAELFVGICHYESAKLYYESGRVNCLGRILD